MKINKNIGNKKRIVIIVVVIILIAAAAFAVWFFYLKGNAKVRQENDVSYKPATEQQQNTGLDAKTNFNDKYYGNAETESNDSNESTERKEVEVLISSINQNEAMMTIATSVYVVNDGGVCKMTLSKKGSDDIVMEAKLHNLSSYSACEDFNFDTTAMAKGEWKLMVNYDGMATFGNATSKVSVK